MHGWKLTLGLCGVALGAALLAPRLFPMLALGGPQETVPDVPVALELPPVLPLELNEPGAVPAAPPTPRTIDLVIALDTSGSMERLIDSTRARLWDIVNEIDARDPDAILRVGLVTYGSPAYGEANDFVKVQVDLTEDLDAVYAKAWEIGVDGGEEFVGAVIDRAARGMSWTADGNPDNRRLLFVAGNETAALGPVPFRMAAARAQEQGIFVNTLFAGTRSAGEALQWPAVAMAGGGRFLAIDAQISAVAVATPYDQELVDLNRQLNGTYVQYDASGAEKLAQIVANDKAAGSLGLGSLASRVSAKGSSKHKVDDWDLVSGLAGGTVDFEDVDAEALPADLKDLDPASLSAELHKRGAERANAKAAIDVAQKKRAAYLRDQAAPGDAQGLDAGMTEVLAEQL